MWCMGLLLGLRVGLNVLWVLSLLRGKQIVLLTLWLMMSLTKLTMLPNQLTMW